MTTPPLDERVVNDFTYHKVTDEQAARMATVRLLCKETAIYIIQSMPTCREQSLALTSLEQVSMWVNAGIARHE